MIQLFISCLISIATANNPTVHIYGALYNIMHQGNMNREVELWDMDPNNLYALGALENLKGEILILNGKSYIAMEENGALVINSGYDYAACLLVGSYVQGWDSVKVKKTDDLQAFISEAATQYGLNTEEAFPFMLKGKFPKIDWHVINWPEGDTEHTHEKHQTVGPHGCLKNEPAQILGFYSTKHAGVFTHHSTYLHMHLLTDDHKVSGHVDQLTPGKDLWLYLPKL